MSTPPAATAAALLSAMRQLEAVLAEENAALKARSGGALKALVARKAAAATAYERAAAAFAATGSETDTAAIDRAHLAALRAGAETLEAVCRENAFRLDVARAAQRRLIEQIVDAAKATAAASAGPGTYGRNGAIGASGRARPPAAASLSFNRAL